jgi:hypothetical protein
MLLVGSKLYSINPDVFNIFENKNYMQMFKAYLYGPIIYEKPHL